MDEINTDLSEILRGLKWLQFLSNCGLLYKTFSTFRLHYKKCSCLVTIGVVTKTRARKYATYFWKIKTFLESINMTVFVI